MGAGGRERGNEGGWGGDGGGWGGQQSCVFVVHNLPDQFNCDRLFNLVCLYGNVSKIFFMKKKEGTAMVEMGDPEAVQRVVSNLNRAEIWGSRLLMDVSRSMINPNNKSAWKFRSNLTKSAQIKQLLMISIHT